MNKRLILVLALALTVGMTFAAYAEVQNVKVSGDIIASGVARNHFNLTNGLEGDKNNIKQSFIMSQTRVRIDADLTDNVAATVRLINERVWNGQYDTASSGNSNIDLDLAYVTLKEFLYSPLTLTVGRQEIKFGNGLVIGKSGAAKDVVNFPEDLSERSAFDAIRATLNYDPLIVDLLYAKVKQYDTSRNNTINLAGINATYALNSKTDISAYAFHKRNNDGGASNSKGKADQVSTIGALISSTPIENLKASLETAFQFGKNDSSNTNASQHKAWALQAMLDYTFAKVKMTPKIGASYTYLSGGENSASRNGSWDSMFYSQALNNITYAILPFSNMSVINLRASAKPVEDVTISANYGFYELAKADSSSTLTSPSSYDGSSTSGHSYLDGATMSGKSHLGDALDLTATYDYTEDVQLALTGGWFVPGKAFASERRNASQLIGSMKVTF
jgi:hypothetical protein